MRARVHVYLPVSEVVRGEKMRETPSLEIRPPSPEVATAVPLTVQTELAVTGVSTDGLRV